MAFARKVGSVKKVYSSVVEDGRESSGVLGTVPGNRNGVFRLRCPVTFATVTVIASDGSHWEEAGLPLPVWEHVSVSMAGRCPSWSQMCWIKSLFFEDDEWVIEFHPAKEEYVNCHPYCLHLWRPIGVKFPTPPSLTVGVIRDASFLKEGR